MRLYYENTFADLVAFRRYSYVCSPIRKQKFLLFGLGKAAAVCASTYLALRFLFRGTFHWAALGIAALYGIFQTLNYLKSERLRLQTGEPCLEGTYKRFLGGHEMEISAEGLVERTCSTETKTLWGEVVRIEATPQYTFIYTASRIAHVIPHHAITQGDFVAFMTQLKQFQPEATRDMLVQ